MTVTGEAVVTPEIYRMAVRRLSRRSFLRVRISGSILLVIGALLLFPELDAMPAGAALFAVGLMFIFYVPFMALRRSAEKVAPALREPWQYEVDDERLKVWTPLATSEYRWDRFTSAQEFAEILAAAYGARAAGSHLGQAGVHAGGPAHRGADHSAVQARRSGRPGRGDAAVGVQVNEEC